MALDSDAALNAAWARRACMIYHLPRSARVAVWLPAASYWASTAGSAESSVLFFGAERMVIKAKEQTNEAIDNVAIFRKQCGGHTQQI